MLNHFTPVVPDSASARHAVLHGGGVQVDVRQRQLDVPRSDVTAETFQVATETSRYLQGNSLSEILLRRAAQRNLKATATGCQFIRYTSLKISGSEPTVAQLHLLQNHSFVSSHGTLVISAFRFRFTDQM